MRVGHFVSNLACVLNWVETAIYEFLVFLVSPVFSFTHWQSYTHFCVDFGNLELSIVSIVVLIGTNTMIGPKLVKILDRNVNALTVHSKGA